MRTIRKLVVGALLCSAGLLLSLPAAAEEELPFVAGDAWMDSAPVLKRSYLIGVGNLLNAEYAYQKEFGPPSDKHSTIARFYEGIEDLSLDQVIDRIDAWYKKNPKKRDMTVLEVIWLDMVRPNLPESRLYH